MTGLMRKHGKVILAVLGSLLMIVFILPNFGSSNADTSAGNFVRGKLNGSKVTNNDISRSSTAVIVLKRFTGVRGMPISLLDYLTIDLQTYARLIPLTNEEELQPIHWYLLSQEAKALGLGTTESEITGFIQSLDISDTDMNAELAHIGAAGPVLRDAIGQALTLQKLGRLTFNTISVSLPDLEYKSALYFNKIQIAYATLDGTRDWEKAAEPTADQIQKQFDLYKDVIATPPVEKSEQADSHPAAPVPAAVNGHTYPFGYKYPDRVKIEYLRFDKAPLSLEFKPTPADFDAAFRYYGEHPDEFKNVVEDKLAAATRPAVKPFEEVQKKLVQDQIDLRAALILKRATDRAVTLTGEAWKNAKTDAGYLVPIPPAQRPDYARIAADLSTNPMYGGVHPLHATTDWLSAEQIAKLPGLKGARLEVDRQHQLPLAQLAMHVKELVGTTNKDAFARYFMEVGPEGPLLTTGSGDYILYRVVDAEKSHDPALDEVRPQVVEDLKKLSVYEARQAQAKKLAKDATAGNLLILAKAENIPASTAADLTQQSREVPGLGTVPGFIEAAYALTREPAATQPKRADGSRNSATTTFASDPTLKVYAIELLSFAPAGPAEFEAQRSMLAARLLAVDNEKFTRDWLNLDAVAARLHYVPTTSFNKIHSSE